LSTTNTNAASLDGELQGCIVSILSDIRDESSLVKIKKGISVFNKAINRIKEVTGKETQKDICNEIGITPRNYRVREEKGEFDANWAYRVGRKYGISTDWILTGRGKKRLSEATNNEFAIKLGKWIDDYSKDDPRKASVAEIKIEDALPEFKEWLDAQDATRTVKAA
jgi:hypothetical protein